MAKPKKVKQDPDKKILKPMTYEMYKDRYNTPLTPIEKKKFNKWSVEESGRMGRDILMDLESYDVQGFWKNNERVDERGHGSDRYKKPNHPTFSNQSMYHGQDGAYGGEWTDSSFIASPINRYYNSPEAMLWQMQADPGIELVYGNEKKNMKNNNVQELGLGGDIAMGAGSGAMAGMALGPWGALAGGVIGAGSALIGGLGAEEEQQAPWAGNNPMMGANNVPTFPMGGAISYGDVPVELENDEVFRKPGDTKIHEVDGKYHSQGGELYKLPVGTDVLGKIKNPITGNPFKLDGMKLKKEQDRILARESRPGTISKDSDDRNLKRIINEYNGLFLAQEKLREEDTVKKSMAKGGGVEDPKINPSQYRAGFGEATKEPPKEMFDDLTGRGRYVYEQSKGKGYFSRFGTDRNTNQFLFDQNLLSQFIEANPNATGEQWKAYQEENAIDYRNLDVGIPGLDMYRRNNPDKLAAAADRKLNRMVKFEQNKERRQRRRQGVDAISYANGGTVQRMHTGGGVHLHPHGNTQNYGPRYDEVASQTGNLGQTPTLDFMAWGDNYNQPNFPLTQSGMGVGTGAMPEGHQYAQPGEMQQQQQSSGYPWEGMSADELYGSGAQQQTQVPQQQTAAPANQAVAPQGAAGVNQAAAPPPTGSVLPTPLGGDWIDTIKEWAGKSKANPADFITGAGLKAANNAGGLASAPSGVYDTMPKTPGAALKGAGVTGAQGVQGAGLGFGQKALQGAGGWGGIASTAAQLGGVAYNLIQGSRPADKLDAKDYYNPQRNQALNMMPDKYNIDPMLEANRNASAIGRYNLSQSGASAGQQYAGQQGLAAGRMRADASAWAQKNNMENQYASNKAQMALGVGNQMAGMDFNVDQINQQSVAAQQAHFGQGLSDLSEYSQNQQQMRNQQMRDATLAGIYPDMFSSIYGFMPGVQNAVNKYS